MDKNPVYEFDSYSAKSPLSDSRTNVLQPTRSKQATRPKNSCRTCASATFAVVAVLALMILAGVIVTVILRLQNAKSESNTEFASLKQEMESLKEFMIQQANVSNELTKVIQVQKSEIDYLKQHLNESTIELQSEIGCLKRNLNESIYNLQTHIQTLSQNFTTEVTIVQQFVMAKINETKYNVTEQINILQTSSSESIQELKQLLHASNVTLTAEIENVQLDCMKKANETQYSIYNVTQEIKILQSSSSENIQELHLLLRASNETFISEIDSVWERQNQNVLDCMIKVNETQTEIYKETQKIDDRIDQLVENFTSDVEAIQIQISTILNTTGLLDELIDQIVANITSDVEAIQNQIRDILARNTTGSQEGPLTCEGLSLPTNGGFSIEAGPNSLSGGLGSVATYTCDPGYALVGQRTRTCEDTNGGTVTIGAWSGERPFCQEILCLEPPTPVNGDAVLSSQGMSVGTTANYSCDSGYVLVGQAIRTCEDVNGDIIGRWSGTTPICEVIIRCQQLTHLTNGEVSVSIGTLGVNLGVGAVATYSCSNGYGLVGQVTRTCVSDGGSSGIWSGSEPTCEEVITCSPLAPPVNGTLTFTPGVDNSNIGLGSVATYSCNLGYVLVGQSIRECLTTNGGAWSGLVPICEEAVFCPILTAPGNGSVTISSGVNPLSVGSVATYSCDPGYALLGPPTRACEDPNTDSVGTWNGTMPDCEVILCPEIMAPVNGTLIISTPSPTQPLGVGTTATYSCDPGYVLVGDLTRTCEDPGTGTVVGTWSGSEVDPTCAIPNRALMDCEDITCRYEQLVCPDRDNCTINCNDTEPYACFRTGVVCPSVLGDCNLNCDDSFACLQANTTCPQGNCNVNCPSDYSCQNSVMQCSGDNCLLSCEGQESCSYSTIESSGENYLLNCEGQDSCSYLDSECSGESCRTNCYNDRSCSHSTLDCSNGNCSLHCTDEYSCQYSTMMCSQGTFCDVNCINEMRACQQSEFVCDQGSTCVFNFDGGNNGDYIGSSTDITCEENSTCSIRCTGLRNSASHQCSNADIVCPTSDGDCTVECSGYYSCQFSRITCGPNSGCLTCSGESSCRESTITLQAGSNAPIMNCNGPSSCQSSRITCPANNNCTINCNAQNSCQSSTIICPTNNNCTINCDGQYSCNNARVTCPTGDYNCNIRCTDPLSCQGLSITNTHNVNLLCCGGPTACAGTSVVPTSIDCPYIN